MLRICALNESGSDRDSDADSVQFETREAQEAHLINLYTTALKSIAGGSVKTAKDHLNEIVSSPVFQEEKEEALAKSLRYNVHKNLGECHLAEGNVSEAQKEMLLAADIDSGDVNLWFKIAGTAVKMKNLYMCRSALEQGLKCSPKHWPSIDNLITVTFKLGDFLSCLGYCSTALELHPNSSKVILYKSKVYNEMPFLQEVYNDQCFVPIETEIETFHTEKEEAPVRPALAFHLVELSLESVASGLYALSVRCEAEDLSLNPIATADASKQLADSRQIEEESKVQVSVQNLVDEIIDIIEAEEDHAAFAAEIVDDLLSYMFGLEPRRLSERIAQDLVGELVNSAVARCDHLVVSTATTIKRKSVVLDAKSRERKKVSVLDEIPDELIEKRRSSRKTRVQEITITSDTSNDPVSIQTPRELLESYLPASLSIALRQQNFDRVQHQPLPGGDNLETTQTKTPSDNSTNTIKWFSPGDEAAQVEKFLKDNTGKTIWHLMRAFLDSMFRLNPSFVWPKNLEALTGKIYLAWRSHLGDPLCVENPEERFTQEFLRYYILGSECLIGPILGEESSTGVANNHGISSNNIGIPVDLRQRLEQDLAELYDILSWLPVDLRLRVHSLRFHYFCLTDNEEEVLYETGKLMQIYEEHDDMVVLQFLPMYKVVSKFYLDNYSSSVKRSKELEELQQYYETKRFEDIVTLLLGTFESTNFTPSKEASKAPNKETQIDILIESLFHVGMYVKCIKWCTLAVSNSIAQFHASSETRRFTQHEWTVIEAYLTTVESSWTFTKSVDLADLPLDIGSKLAAVLIHIITVQIDEPIHSDLTFNAALPWILLHQLTVWAENRYSDQSSAVRDPAVMPGSLNLLCSGHDYLGQRSCCTGDNGRLLNYMVDEFIPVLLDNPKPKYADQLKTNLDQAIYCLYAHPSKKTRVRHLADHGVSQIGLSWDHACKLYNYIKPNKTPEHDDVKLLSITPDTASFLKRLVALVPPRFKLEERKTNAQDFVYGKKKKLKLKHLPKLPIDLQDLFYLLADSAFKNGNDFGKAIDYYTADISFNPDRYDSWAALALAMASRMEKRLNSCTSLSPIKVLDFVSGVENCFKSCLRMNDSNSNIWIEFGNFCYNVHSYISRTLQNNTEGMNIDLFEQLESKRDVLLKTAMDNYTRTLEIFERDGIDENDVDERWLIHYMIGKIKEKTVGSLTDSLRCYITSMNCLERNGSVLPRKVNYNSPQPLSLETLEIYYRVHASILKFLIKFENKESSALDEAFRQELYDVMKVVQLSRVYNTNAPEDHNVRFSRKCKRAMVSAADELTGKMSRTDESSTTIMRDVIEVMDNMIDEVDFANDTAKLEVSQLVRLALMGLEDVAYHFFHHFKALYRLAHYYHTSTHNRMLHRVQKLLLAGANEKNVLCPGLFFGRKPNQIFNDIWRIPISEIDRPGSFATHCAKSLTLLLDVLRALPDLNTLTDIAIQMRKSPSEENKFVHETDRIEMGTMAITYLLNTIKEMVAKVSLEAEMKKPSIILDIFRVYQKLLKLWTGKEKEVLAQLKDLYCKIKGRSDKDKISNEEVIKFCNLEINRQKTTNYVSSRAQTGLQPSTTQSMTSTSTLVGSANTGIKSATTILSNTCATIAVSATNTTATNIVSNATAIAQSEEIKQKSLLLAYLQKVMNFQEMVALSLPNMTNQDISAVCDLKWEEQPKKINFFFQSLLKMSLVQLRAINFDSTKLSVIHSFAVRVGLVPSSVNVYVSRLKAVLSGQPLATPPPPKKAACTLQPPVAMTSSNIATCTGKVNLNKTPHLGPKLTPGQRNLKQLQMLLKQQDGPPSKSLQVAKGLMSSNSVTIVSSSNIKSSTAARSSSNSLQGVVSKPSKSAVSASATGQTGRLTGFGKSVAGSTSLVVASNAASGSGSTISADTLKNLPAGITLTVEKKSASPNPSGTTRETNTPTQHNKGQPAKNSFAGLTGNTAAGGVTATQICSTSISRASSQASGSGLAKHGDTTSLISSPKNQLANFRAEISKSLLCGTGNPGPAVRGKVAVSKGRQSTRGRTGGNPGARNKSSLGVKQGQIVKRQVGKPAHKPTGKPQAKPSDDPPEIICID